MCVCVCVSLHANEGIEIVINVHDDSTQQNNWFYERLIASHISAFSNINVKFLFIFFVCFITDSFKDNTRGHTPHCLLI